MGDNDFFGSFFLYQVAPPQFFTWFFGTFCDLYPGGLSSFFGGEATSLFLEAHPTAAAAALNKTVRCFFVSPPLE